MPSCWTVDKDFSKWLDWECSDLRVEEGIQEECVQVVIRDTCWWCLEKKVLKKKETRWKKERNRWEPSRLPTKLTHSVSQRGKKYNLSNNAGQRVQQYSSRTRIVHILTLLLLLLLLFHLYLKFSCWKLHDFFSLLLLLLDVALCWCVQCVCVCVYVWLVRKKIWWYRQEREREHRQWTQSGLGKSSAESNVQLLSITRWNY